MNAMKARLLAVLLLLAAAAPTRALAQPLDVCEPVRPPETEHFSFRGFGHQLGRGLVNVAFCWLEVPYQIKSSLSEACPIYEWGVFTSTVYLVNGAVSGVVEGAFRGVTGVFEVAFSPLPPYNPVSCPAWPPYIGPRELPPVEVAQK